MYEPAPRAANLTPTDKVKVAYSVLVMGLKAQDIAHMYPGINPGRLAEAVTAIEFASKYTDKVNEMRKGD
jgi:hypothetical protein